MNLFLGWPGVTNSENIDFDNRLQQGQPVATTVWRFALALLPILVLRPMQIKSNRPAQPAQGPRT